MEDSENTISKRLNSIKDSIVTSSTYKLKDTEKFKNESTYEKEKYNITKNNTAEARQHAKENLKNGNIN
jgi:cystathionine beta-lyase/cystathionine gamma-synthase